MKLSWTKMLMTIAALAAATVGTVSAQSFSGLEAKNVPFAFEIMNQVMPAGHYRITPQSALQYRIQQVGGEGRAAIVLATSAATGNKIGRPHLMFRCYAERCTLAEIWGPGTTGVTRRTVDWEKKVREQQPELKVAEISIPLSKQGD